MIINLKRWERVTYHAEQAGEEGDESLVAFSMELKRLKRHEAKPLQKALIGVFKTMEATQEGALTGSQKAELLADLYEHVGDEQLRQWFTTWIRDVRDLSVDGEAITTGLALFEEVADDNLIGFVLLNIASLARLTPAEGKGSASRSTSSQAQLPEGSSSGSPATSTDSEACPQPSTATETLDEPVSSSELVEA